MSDKDKFYDLMTNPTKEAFADFMQSHSYESNNLDFKQEWIEKGKLAKILLAIANSGGGFVVFGVKDGTFEPCGIESLKDASEIDNSVKKYIPSNLKYRVENYEFSRSEYEKLVNKKFQLIIINDTPEHLPFISTSNDDDIANTAIYVRHGTKCEKANNDDIENLINRRVQTGYISKISFAEHITQLQILYERKQECIIRRMFLVTDFANYLDELIKNKKKIITKIMGLE